MTILPSNASAGSASYLPKGTATSTTSPKRAASSVLVARPRPPSSATRASSPAPPRELLIATSCPAPANSFAAVQERFGRLDVLFVNAGVAQFAPVEETDEELFDRVMDINFKGAYFTVKKALPLLVDGASVILNTSVVAHIGLPNSSVYSASKAALLSLVRTLSADLNGRRIRVNAVSPGPVETPIFGRMGLPEEAKQGFGEQVPLKRLGRPEEIAKAVLFLAGPDSSFLLGTEIVADGGIIGLKVTDAAANQEPASRAEAA